MKAVIFLLKTAFRKSINIFPILLERYLLISYTGSQDQKSQSDGHAIYFGHLYQKLCRSSNPNLRMEQNIVSHHVKICIEAKEFYFENYVNLILTHASYIVILKRKISETTIYIYNTNLINKDTINCPNF